MHGAGFGRHSVCPHHLPRCFIYCRQLKIQAEKLEEPPSKLAAGVCCKSSLDFRIRRPVPVLKWTYAPAPFNCPHRVEVDIFTGEHNFRTDSAGTTDDFHFLSRLLAIFSHSGPPFNEEPIPSPSPFIDKIAQWRPRLPPAPCGASAQARHNKGTLSELKTSACILVGVCRVSR